MRRVIISAGIGIVAAGTLALAAMAASAATSAASKPAFHVPGTARNCRELKDDVDELNKALGELRVRFDAAEKDGNGVLAWYLQQRIYYDQNQIDNDETEEEAIEGCYSSFPGNPIPGPTG